MIENPTKFIGRIEKDKPKYLFKEQSDSFGDAMEIRGDFTDKEIANFVIEAVRKGKMDIPELNITLKTIGPRVYELISTEDGEVKRRIVV